MVGDRVSRFGWDHGDEHYCQPKCRYLGDSGNSTCRAASCTGCGNRGNLGTTDTRMPLGSFVWRPHYRFSALLPTIYNARPNANTLMVRYSMGEAAGTSLG